MNHEADQKDEQKARDGSDSLWPLPPQQRWVLAGVLLLVAGAAVLWLGHEAEPRERDYHAVKQEFERIERTIHAHDMGLWRLVEGEPHDSAGVQEERHRRILSDFEKIGHAQRFEMAEVTIEIDGDRAHLRYALQTWPQPWKPMPSAWSSSGGRADGS